MGLTCQQMMKAFLLQHAPLDYSYRNYNPSTPLYISAASDPTVSVEINGGNGDAGAYVYRFSGSNDFTTKFFDNTGLFQLSRGTHGDCLGANDTSNIVFKGNCTSFGDDFLWWGYTTPSQQLWSYSPDGTLKPKSNPNLCLDVNGPFQDYTPLIVNPCNGAKSQSWTFDPLWMTFTNNASANLVINDFHQEPNGDVIVYTNDHTVAGAWQMGGNYVRINAGTYNYIFDSNNNNLAIQAANDGSVSLQGWSSGSKFQLFTNDNGFLRWNANPAMCLSIGNSHSIGFDVVLDSCVRGGTIHATKWTISGQQIQASTNSQCLQAFGGAYMSGAQIVT
ncbi:hypothetical protein HDU76_005818 [Blyttiomyces sp. JEL0837]|nr:hypothetical protein HDU76_005818 [Blyttiomyces sp. JEL0837]